MNPKFLTHRLLALALLLAIPALASAEHLEEHSSDQQITTGSSLLYGLTKPVPAEPYWYLQTSVYTTHYKPKSAHNNNQELIGLERHTENSYLMGGATFLHSYGKRSYYGYVGKRYDFASSPFYGKISAGLLYGYKGKYRDKIPLNHFEIAPAIVPSIGVQYRSVAAEVVLLGAAASMVTVGVKL